MTTDTFEDELRSLLHEAADAEGRPYVDVGPDAVVTRGRRVVRRRRLAAAAGIAAAVLAVGLVGFSAVTGGSDRTSAPASSTVASTPVPPVSAELTRRAAVGQRWGAPDGRPDVRVTVDVPAGSVSYSVLGEGGAVLDRGSDGLSTAYRTLTWMSPEGGGLTVGVLPLSAKDVAPVWAGEPPASTLTVQPLRGTVYQAFALWHDTSTSARLAGLDWTDGTSVYSALGAVVPSMKEGGDVFFVDATHDLFGVFGSATTSTRWLSDTPAGKQPALLTGRVPDGSDTMEATVLVLLPADARTVVVTPSAGATVRTVGTTGGISPTHALVVVRLTMPKDTPGTGVDHVSWTSPDGGTRSSAVG